MIFSAKGDLVIQDLSCKRGGRNIIESLSFTIKPGQLLSLTGPNGCGKSTLFSALAGVLPFSSGQILWQGKPWGRENLLYLSHKEYLYDRATVLENLETLAALHGKELVNPSDILAAWNLEHLSHVMTYKLSLGQRRRLSLCQIDINQDQQVWLFDEASFGLDKEGEEIFESKLNAHIRQQGCVLITSHTRVPAEHVVCLDEKQRAA